MNIIKLTLSIIFLIFHTYAQDKTNFILCMTDDQGWGDVGYMGHSPVKTPVLDDMASSGLRCDRFYAAAPICSPSRGGFMTGRSPSRYGSYSWGYITRTEEITLGELGQSAGYATGHFGKWHLGPALKDHPLSPDKQGFDRWVSHDNFFDLDPKLSDNGSEPMTYPGETSDICAAEAVKFIRKCKEAKKPFLIVIWFPSPHSPHQAAKKDLALYPDANKKVQNYLGELSGVDRAMGTIRQELRTLGIHKNTFLLFTSDNGATKSGSNGGLSGSKGKFLEGGIRVPGIIEWPARIQKPRITKIPCGAIDLFPTIREIIGAEKIATDRPIDGISILPLIDGKWTSRPKPMGFGIVKTKTVVNDKKWFHGYTDTGKARSFKSGTYSNPQDSSSGDKGVWIDNNYKLLDGKLFDLEKDPNEKNDLSKEMPERYGLMKKALGKWQVSVARSLCGMDYKKE